MQYSLCLSTVSIFGQNYLSSPFSCSLFTLIRTEFMEVIHFSFVCICQCITCFCDIMKYSTTRSTTCSWCVWMMLLCHLHKTGEQNKNNDKGSKEKGNANWPFQNYLSELGYEGVLDILAKLGVWQYFFQSLGYVLIILLRLVYQRREDMNKDIKRIAVCFLSADETR